MTAGAPPAPPPAVAYVEPPVYRPFALLAFGTTTLVASPLGVWLLGWLYGGWAAATPAWRSVHAGLQAFGFFAPLIVGVAHHLVPRFTGGAVAPTRLGPWLLALLGSGTLLRVGALLPDARAAAVAASLLQALALILFAAWIHRTLAPPPLAVVRRHLTAATAWLVGALALDAAVGAGVVGGLPGTGLRTVYAMAIGAGVIGWILGVLLRAGPMFVADWRVPAALARAVPWLLAAGVALVAAGELGGGPRLARAGEALAPGTAVMMAVAAGASRRRPRGLPMLARGAPETRLFRLALASAAAAAGGGLIVAAAPRAGAVADDALRHLVTVGFVGGVVVAMAFRLLVVLERRPLPWPRLRAVAFASLLASVVLRTAQVAAGDVPGLAPWIPLSGVLAWAAFATVAVSLAAVALRRTAAR